ncbi:MAG: prenyltransferase [Bdellovibrionia bacterium]
MNQEIFSLRHDSAELLPLLYEGRMLRHGEPWVALPRELVAGAKGIEAVVFEVMRRETMVLPSRLKILWAVIRPESLTLTLSPCLAIMSYGFYLGWEASWGIGLLAVLGALLFQISANLFNDVEDHLRLIDLLGCQGGSHVIQNGWLNARQVKRLAYTALVLGALFGVPAVLNSPQILLSIGGAGVLGVLAYSNRPFGVKYRVLGGAAVFFLGGPLLALGIAQAAFGRMDSGVLSLGCFFGMASLGVSHAGNFQDIEVDQARNLETLASKFGFSSSRHFFPLFYGLAFLSLSIGMGWGGLPSMLGIAVCASLHWVVQYISTLYRASGPASALLVPIRKDSLRIHLVFGASSILGLLGAYWAATNQLILSNN